MRNIKVRLGDNTEVCLGQNSARLELGVPEAAELIVAIATNDQFDASPAEKEALRLVAQRIASRYSGH